MTKFRADDENASLARQRYDKMCSVLNVMKRHPFGVEAFFRRSLVLTYAVPRVLLEDLVAPGLTLDTYDDFGFIAIAMVQTEALRPRGFPEWLGRNFFLSGYRIFTRFIRPNRATLRGLFILRSDTDRPMMKVLGNVFTQYHYRLAHVEVHAGEERLEVRVRTRSREADLHVIADLSSRPAALPESSVFRSMEDARSFAGPLPHTFSYERALDQMVIIKGVRKEWNPEPVHVDVLEATYLDQPRFKNAGLRLANAFYLENVPYSWQPGRLESIDRIEDDEPKRTADDEPRRMEFDEPKRQNGSTSRAEPIVESTNTERA